MTHTSSEETKEEIQNSLAVKATGKHTGMSISGATRGGVEEGHGQNVDGCVAGEELPGRRRAWSFAAGREARTACQWLQQHNTQDSREREREVDLVFS